MFCIHCGTQLPKEAKFCYQCGKRVECKDNSPEKSSREIVTQSAEQPAVCEIVYVLVQEKKGLFPKEKGRFEAVTSGCKEKQVIAASQVFDLGGLSIYGPEEKNPRHKEQLETVAKTLKAEGWIQQKKPGTIWYNLKFERLANNEE